MEKVFFRILLCAIGDFFAITSRSDALPVDFWRFSGFLDARLLSGFASFFSVAQVRQDMVAT
ncbi:MAG: hypothetical protein LBB60_01660, partial [Desulfovibrio sp.]|nr:hypothetical protein [Desulfovibrio sp.]